MRRHCEDFRDLNRMHQPERLREEWYLRYGSMTWRESFSGRDTSVFPFVI